MCNVITSVWYYHIYAPCKQAADWA